MCLICGSSKRIGSEVSIHVNVLRRFGRSSLPRFIKAIFPHISEMPAILPDKRAGHWASCLCKSAMKQRLGYDSADIMRAANAATLMRATPKKGSPVVPGGGWPASTGGGKVSRPEWASDREFCAAVVSSSRPNLLSGRCTSYCSPCFQASGRLLLADSGSARVTRRTWKRSVA